MKNRKELNKQLTILFENIMILCVLFVVIIFIFAVMLLYVKYNILPKYYAWMQPIPLTHEELVELLKTKGINACKEWPKDYPTIEERPCYIKGIDRDGDKYCDVVCTQSQVSTGLTNSYCSDFWEYIKNQPPIDRGKPMKFDLPIKK